MGLFKKEEHKVGFWLMVDFSNESKEMSVGGNHNKVIIHMYEGNKIKTEQYTESREIRYRREGQILIDVTGGSDFPMDSVMLPRESVVFGTIELRKNIYI